jgi:RNA polymerase sigma-70 factor (ECF subfamily)
VLRRNLHGRGTYTARRGDSSGIAWSGTDDRARRVDGCVVDRPQSEARIVLSAQRGDVDAYASLVRTYQDVAFRTAYLVTHDAADAEEAVQDAFVKAWKALARFDRARPFRPWLLRIVVNEARNRRRSAGRHSAIAQRAITEASGGAVPPPEVPAAGAVLSARLLDAVNGLPEEQRLVIAARYFLDLSESETAEVLRVRRGTVKSRLSRALDRLRDEIGAQP